MLKLIKALAFIEADIDFGEDMSDLDNDLKRCGASSDTSNVNNNTM